MRAYSSKRIAIAFAVIVGFLSLAAIGAAVARIYVSPIYIRVFEGQTFSVDMGPLGRGAVVVDPPDSLLMDAAIGSKVEVTPTKAGRTRLEVRLFNAIPVKRLVVDVVPQMRVIPGGHSIGILLASRGVRVMGMYPVVGSDGLRYMPARDGGIEVGDMIVSVDGYEVHEPRQLETLVSEGALGGRPVRMGIVRDGREFDVTVLPAPADGGYRIGVYVRDNAAGVGTLTFWHPGTMRYGALGHVVVDSQTGKEIPITDGRIVSARVSGIDLSGAGRPGEKIGTFAGARDNVGVVEANTEVGIYGTLDAPLPNPYYPDPIPVALAAAVHEGPAEILTVVTGSSIERFEIEIVKVAKQSRIAGKGIVIRVVDPRLLELTGGIVQGMSGSPIIQDGKLVGAVTHVFVSDPSRGYGVFAEHMLNVAGLMEGSERAAGWIVLLAA
ncbi:MAG TPA: SpoIVB peptidase [Bacillota bacterium]|nr:SpoIVB peptidase [Bacillota bacterium]HPZ12795.1 SpoIVB peptidase [Bacillota bacterium]HQD79853.1 SpoIVB peptidase [Bacillota bacterium]